jgi:predicted transcriptional regulator
MNDKTEVTLKLPSDVADQLEKIADRAGVSTDAVVSVMLTLFLMREELK